MAEIQVPTLEDLQARVLELEQENATLKADAENYRTQISERDATIQKVRDRNQEMFLRLQQQYNPPTQTDPDEEVPTCEEFAKTLDL